MAFVAPIPTTYPRGVITVQAQNVTTGGKLSDNTVSVRPGDQVRYVVTISNPSKDTNLVNANVETWLSGSFNKKDSSNQIKDQLGTIALNSLVTKEYTLTVNETATFGPTSIESCVNGNNSSATSPVRGCDKLDFKIEAKASDSTPSTGMSSLSIILAVFGALVGGYILRLRSIKLGSRKAV